ncbi:hypothetical protein BUZ69_04450 [Staphylococcus saprophyticus]|uniref:hypothetical protein n=1 Tax=Staphylococcus saprophyticus TaxID=29385 RepID=UPI000D1EB753|nr:hypothetical protein [Staphylococcus saprophyticus]PTK47091.1 hypothetical protein BUZ69_04450 [Staphylococcus saprophyticus]
MGVLIQTLIVSLIGVVILYKVVKMRNRLVESRFEWYQNKIDNNEFVKGVVTKKDVTGNDYYIEIDNQNRFKVKGLKMYNALSLNQTYKVLVEDKEIKYIDGNTTLEEAVEKDVGAMNVKAYKRKRSA